MGFHELEIGRRLGEGGFGVVRLARHRVSGALYAVKSIEKARIRRIGEERTFELLERERRKERHDPQPCVPCAPSALRPAHAWLAALVCVRMLTPEGSRQLPPVTTAAHELPLSDHSLTSLLLRVAGSS